MDVDKAGRYDLAFGIDFFPASAGYISDRSDFPISNRDISVEEWTARAIGDLAIADYEVVLGCHWQYLRYDFSQTVCLE